LDDHEPKRRRWEVKGFTVRRGLACLAAACVVLATGAVALRPAAAESAVMRVARVEGSGVNLREEPSTSGKKLGSLSNGDLLLVLDEKKGDKHPWYRVLTDGAVEGWMYGQYVKFRPGTDRLEGFNSEAYERFESFHATVLDQMPDTIKGARKRFGKPASTEHSVVPSDHDPETEVKYYTLKYPAFELMYYEVETRNGLLGIELLEPGLTLGEGVRLGADISEIVGEVGVPLFCEDSTLTWTDESGYSELSVTLDGRRVAKVKLQSWLD
jgi:hypothetical protein